MHIGNGGIKTKLIQMTLPRHLWGLLCLFTMAFIYGSTLPSFFFRVKMLDGDRDMDVRAL